MPRRVIIAIDGPVGAGKSSVARILAKRLGFVYIDTGAMYRAVGLWALRLAVDLSDVPKLAQLAEQAEIELHDGGSRVLLNGEDVTEAIRAPEISDASSRISVFTSVRTPIVERARDMGKRESVVIEGRDTGTVIFPCADVKIFLDAAPSERVKRRAAEHKDLEASELAAQVCERDLRDSTRAESPLSQAPDALYLDSTGLSIDQVVETILRLVRERVSNGKDFS